MTQSRNLYYDFVKGVLIFLVILGHSIQYLEFNLTSNTYYNSLFKFIYMFHMPLFLGISGYFSYSSINNTHNFILFLKKKIIHLLLPMFTWCIFLYLVKYPNINDLTLKNFIYILNTAPSYWFVWAILAYSILIYFLSKIKRHNTILLIISSIVLTLISVPYPHYSIVQSMYPFFILGYLCKALSIDKLLVFTKKILPLILLSFVACFFLWKRNIFVYETPSSFYDIYSLKITIFRFIASCISSISILHILYYIYCKTSSYKLILFICKIGKETFGIFLIQELFFLIIGKYILNNFSIKANNIECIIISIIISIIFYCITLGLSKNKFTKTIFLGK